jgi:hypothetical protein
LFHSLLLMISLWLRYFICSSIFLFHHIFVFNLSKFINNEIYLSSISHHCFYIGWILLAFVHSFMWKSALR